MEYLKSEPSLEKLVLENPGHLVPVTGRLSGLRAKYIPHHAMPPPPQSSPLWGPASVSSSLDGWLKSVSPPPERAWRGWRASRATAMIKGWKLGPRAGRLKELELFLLEKARARPNSPNSERSHTNLTLALTFSSHLQISSQEPVRS